MGDDIVGADGLKTYTNEEIPIQSSYLSCEPSSAKMYRRLDCCDAEPLISARDHQLTTEMLYVEDSYTFFTTLLESSVLNGFDVYIRKSII